MNYYTSYYGNRQLDPNKHYLVRISNSAPAGVPINHVIKEAIPDWNTLVKPYKEDRLNKVDYTIKYKRQLDAAEFAILLELDTVKEKAEGKDLVFLCYEKPTDFCHRHIFAQWLGQRSEQYRLQVEELQNTTNQPTLF